MTTRPVPVGRVARGGAQIPAQEDKRTSAAMAELMRALPQKDAPQPVTFDPLLVVQGTSPALADKLYFVRLKNIIEDTPCGAILAQPGIPPVGPASMGLALYEYSAQGGDQTVAVLRLIPQVSKWFKMTALGSGSILLTLQTPYILKKDKAYFVALVVSEALCTSCNYASSAALQMALRTLVNVTLATGFPPQIELAVPSITVGLTPDVFYAAAFPNTTSFFLY